MLEPAWGVGFNRRLLGPLSHWGAPKHCRSQVQMSVGVLEGLFPVLLQRGLLAQEEASASALTLDDTCLPPTLSLSGACRTHLCLGGEAGSGEGSPPSDEAKGRKGRWGAASSELFTPLRPARPYRSFPLLNTWWPTSS